MPKKQTAEQTPDTKLESVAKAIGTVAGKIAGMAGATVERPKRVKPGQLVKKNKTRLPRREKKALQKATLKKASAK